MGKRLQDQEDIVKKALRGSLRKPDGCSDWPIPSITMPTDATNSHLGVDQRIKLEWARCSKILKG